MLCCEKGRENVSLPMRGEWIEMNLDRVRSAVMPSLPMRGEWIEIRL